MAAHIATANETMTGQAPATGAKASHGILLVMGAWLTVLAAGLLGPVLPQIGQTYSNYPNVELLVGFVATMPALAVAIFAIPSGWLADRIGLVRVFKIGLVIYGIAGILPFWINDIYFLVGTRFLVGIGEAAVMATSTALIGIYFTGAARERWLSGQVASANALAIGVVFAGGMLGLAGWHVPFLVYAFAFVMLAGAMIVLREGNLPQTAAPTVGSIEKVTLPKGFVATVSYICILIGIQSIALTNFPAQLPFIFFERGATDSAQIGIGISISVIGVAVGAIVGGLLTSVHWRIRTALGFILAGAGYFAMGQVTGFMPTALTGALAGFGCGAIIPALLPALMQKTPVALIGRIIGFWTAAAFIAQFINPPVFIWLKSMTGGSLPEAMSIFGAFCAVAGVVVFLTAGRGEKA